MGEPNQKDTSKGKSGPDEQRPQPKEPHFWDKVDILLRPIGGLATAAVVAYIGYTGSDVLQARQETNAKVQLYAQIMSSREAAETGLRREMFNSIIQTFLKPNDGDRNMPRSRELQQRILAVQLLTYNFHDALDLGPLFKYLEHEVNEIYVDDEEAKKVSRKRLKRTARDVISKQLAALESDGALKAKTYFLRKKDRGIAHINDTLPESPVYKDDTVSDMRKSPDDSMEQYTHLPPKRFRVEVLDWDLASEEVKVRLKVLDPQSADVEFDEVFSVGWFDFPLIDNTRLTGGGRCAVVLLKFTSLKEDDSDGHVKLSLVYFHGSRASLKTKPYYDDIIRDAIGKNDTN
jgi:hypothetical protein